MKIRMHSETSMLKMLIAATKSISLWCAVQEAVVDGVGQYIEGVLQPVLVQGLTVLAKEKPCAHPIEALSFLGQWLLDNNPNKVCVHTVDSVAYCLGIPNHVTCDCHIQLKSAAAINSKFCLKYLISPLDLAHQHQICSR